MPSLWNKYKGSRISRLVSDLQSTPKRGNSLVVESGFPTSIADFLVKNHEKMKSSKKKHRSATFSRSVSDSPVNPPKLDMPTCSIGVNSNLYDDDNISRGNPNFESNRPPNGSDYEYEIEIEDCEKTNRVSNSYYRSIWMLVLNGVVVVFVGLYTKSFVLGVSIGAFLFCLLEYLGKSVFGVFKPCEKVRRKLGGFPINHIVSKRRRWVDGKKNGKKSRHVVLKREKESGENGVVSTRVTETKMECVDSQKGEIVKYEVRDVVVSRSGVEPQDRDGFASIDELVEQGNVADNLYEKELCKLEQELQRDEIEASKPFTSESNGTSLTPFELREAKEVVECGEDESEGFETDDRNAKVKKAKKRFWKKLVPKKSKKKKNKHQKEQDQESEAGPEGPPDHIEEISLVSEEGNEQHDERESVGEGARSSSFSIPPLDKKESEGVERVIGVVNHCIPEMLHTDECNKSSILIKKKGRNLRSLGILGVVLAGLVGGRVFALVLTVVCCLMLKMVRD